MNISDSTVEHEFEGNHRYVTMPRLNKPSGAIRRVDSKADTDASLADEPNLVARNFLSLSRSQSLNDPFKRWSLVPALLRSAYEAIPDAVLLLDYDRELLLYANKPARTLLLNERLLPDNGLPLSQFIAENERFLLWEAQNQHVVIHWRVSGTQRLRFRARGNVLSMSSFVSSNWIVLLVSGAKEELGDSSSFESFNNSNSTGPASNLSMQSFDQSFEESETPQSSNKYFSRYHMEFEELGMLGNGGFGRVTRVRNRLDGMEYAIKIVRLRGSLDDFLPRAWSNTLEVSSTSLHSRHISDSDHRLLREVKMFARISHHPNIVRYYNAWIEAANDDYIDEPDDGVPEVSTDSGSVSDGDSSGLRLENDGRPQAALYIQMQLCPYKDLRAWLQDRGSEVNQWMNLRIFRQVAEALHHCHLQDVVHRDLKPENIFINEDRVFLGDFGLATQLEGMAALNASVSEASGEVSPIGTLTYAPPELLFQRPVSDPKKSDIYSLGILLFELFVPFTTEMERAKVLSKLRNNFALPVSLVQTFPAEASLIASLLATNPDLRPCTMDILAHEVFNRLDEHESNIQLNELLSKTALSQPLSSVKSPVAFRRRNRASSIHTSLLCPASLSTATFSSLYDDDALKDLYVLSAPASGVSSPVSPTLLNKGCPSAVPHEFKYPLGDRLTTESASGADSDHILSGLSVLLEQASKQASEAPRAVFPLPLRSVSTGSRHSRSRSDVIKRDHPPLPLLNIEIKEHPRGLASAQPTKQPPSVSTEELKTELDLLDSQLKEARRQMNELKKKKLTVQLRLRGSDLKAS